MSAQRQSQEKQRTVPLLTSAASTRLQPKCDCGLHTIAGGECEDCGKKHLSLQRSTRDSKLGTRDLGGVSSIVDKVLGSPGQPLEAATRGFFEPRFGRDFSHVRVHTDGYAAQSATQIGARAWTFGSDVAFGSGMYAPATARGAGLLAHELTHVAQQHNRPRAETASELGARDDRYEREADRVAATVAAGGGPLPLTTVPEARVQGSFLTGLLDVLLFIPRLFGLEYFPAEDLKKYLAELKKRKGPELGLFSDNKARACVSREKEFGPYDTDTKKYLILDMLDGWTLGADEAAVISLLRGAQPAESKAIVAAIGRDRLWSKFDGRNGRIIEAMTMTAADAGEALVSRLRKLDPSEIQDYSANTTEPAVRESIRQATALSKMTAPVPAGATITPAGEANLTINGVRVIVQQDQIKPALGEHAFTRALCQWSAPGPVTVTPQNGNQPVGPFDPVDIWVTIWTEFPSEESKRKPSGYGVGTRPQDQPTLRYHERAHGEAWFKFLKDYTPPVFTGTSGMFPNQFNAALQDFDNAIRAYQHRADEFALKAGDCVGKLPTDEQLAGTGFTAAICH